MSSNSKAYVWVALIFTAVVASLLRLPSLDLRPMHGDEANQGVKTGLLLEQGEYRYDPKDHHGPTLYYLGMLSAKRRGVENLAGLSERDLRIVPALFGVGLIVLLWTLRSSLGVTAVVCMSLLAAISPPLAYYSRYYIQESLLVFFTVATCLSLWRYCLHPSYRWAILTGASIALMQATKETAVLAYAAAVPALYFAIRSTHPKVTEIIRERVRRGHVAAAAMVFVSIVIVLYSSFFTNARGPLDAILTYVNYFERADGAGLHDKPWYYYLMTLAYVHRGSRPEIWTEALTLVLALVGLVTSLAQLRPSANEKNPAAIFVAVYTLILTLLYSAIPYKTPWSMLSFYIGLVVLAGIGMAWIINRWPSPLVRTMAVAIFAAGATQLASQSFRANFQLPAHPSNPYVYAHTSTTHLELIDQIEGISELHPDKKSMQINVVQPNRDYWPFPWYLRGFSNVGYFDTIPDSADAPLLILEPSIYPELEGALEQKYMGITGALRPNVMRTVLIEQELWNAYIETRQ